MCGVGKEVFHSNTGLELPPKRDNAGLEWYEKKGKHHPMRLGGILHDKNQFPRSLERALGHTVIWPPIAK